MRITADPRVLARYPGAWRQASRVLERHCAERAIDVLHVHHPVTALYGARASRRLGIPMVLHVHETLPARPLYAAAMRVAIRCAASMICVSPAALRLAEAHGAGAGRARVINNGIDGRFFSNARLAMPEPLRSAGPGPHLGVFGVLEPRKAQHILLEAAAALSERFPGLRLWLVGPAALADKAAYVERLNALAATPALRGRVAFTGFQSDIAPWLAAMDIVVQTSVALESFGMAIAEAMALGRPVVVSRIGGLPEVVSDERSGLIVEPADAPGLAAALTRLLDDPALRARLGSQAAIDARARFTPGVFRRAVAETYDEVLRSPLQRRAAAAA
jgi:glycosyltransferase involved in cell wall biosynthesis